ncbi:MAG: hypothetical protein L0Z55_10910 [Planctomycetes bacterium]|nr:hypothetical protein [Planctomycetota bacterium]
MNDPGLGPGRAEDAAGDPGAEVARAEAALPGEAARGTDDYLFCELSIDSPLDEFRRTCASKVRALAPSAESAVRERYRRAAALGESVLKRLLGESSR